VMLAIGSRMHGWMLILHMTIAPLFAICIAALSLLWSSRRRASPVLLLVLLASFLTIVTALLGMTSWFGSDGQRTLLTLHRVSAMLLLIAAAWQASQMLLSQHAQSARD